MRIQGSKRYHKNQTTPGNGSEERLSAPNPKAFPAFYRHDKSIRKYWEKSKKEERKLEKHGILEVKEEKGGIFMYRYENAASGLKKMFTAQIGAIVCAVFAVIPIIGLLGAAGVLVFAVLSLVGLNSAGKDIEGCKTAFTLTIVQMAVSILGNFCGTGFLSTVFSVVYDILALLIVRAVCLSVAEVMEELNHRDVAEKGRSVWKINLGCYVADMILTVLAVIPFLGTALATVGGIITVVLSLVAGVMYIVFLSSSYKALEIQ